MAKEDTKIENKNESKEKKEKSSISDVKKILSKKKETEKKVELERTYVVPLRRGYLKVPKYKRAKKAVKTLKEFLAKHMKVENRDINKVKIDIYLNNEIWFRGIKKPLHKVKVHAKKIDGIVYAELAEIPEVVKYKMQKDAKRTTKVDKKALNKIVSKEVEEEKLKDSVDSEKISEEEKPLEVKEEVVEEKKVEKKVETKKEKEKKPVVKTKTSEVKKKTVSGKQ